MHYKMFGFRGTMPQNCMLWGTKKLSSALLMRGFGLPLKGLCPSWIWIWPDNVDCFAIFRALLLDCMKPLSICLFLVANTQLYKPLCRLVCLLVSHLVGQLVGWLVTNCSEHTTFVNQPCLYTFQTIYDIVSPCSAFKTETIRDREAKREKEKERER